MQKQPLNKDVRTENKTEVILPEDILTLKKFFAQRNIPLCQAENDCFRSPDIKNSSLRIALIAEPRLHECLQYEGHIIPLTPENYTAQLRYGKPDLLLIESFWRDSLNAWPLAFTAASPLHQTLRHLLLLAGEQGIPRAFWLTKDSCYQPLYRDILPYFDALFHADPQAGPLLAQEGFTSKELLPCIQPALHNPCQTPTHAKEEKYPLVLDGARDLMKIPALAKLFKQLEKQKAVCMESRDYIQGSEADILRERYLQHSNTYLGSVDAQGRLAILKKAQACLMTSFSSESSTSLMWKALEQAGIRVPTLFYGPTIEHPFAENIFIPCSTEEDVEIAFFAMQKEHIHRERQAQKAWRQAHQFHTCAHRLQTICQYLGITHDWSEYPRVSLLCPISRPENFHDVQQIFERQTWPNKELVLVCHGFCPPKTEDSEQKNIRILSLPGDLSANAILNWGSLHASGDYIFWINSENIYFSNYILDMMLMARAVDADIFGKQLQWVSHNKQLIQQDKETAIVVLDSNSIDKNPILGNSISGKKSVLTDKNLTGAINDLETPFNIDLQNNLKYLVTDPFNMIVCCSEDENRYTGEISKKSQQMPPNELILQDISI